MAGELQEHRIRLIVAELRNLVRLLNQRQPQVSFLRQSAKNFDGRDLLRLSSELETETQSLEHHLSALIGSGRSYARAVGSRLPQEIAPGHLTPTSGGDLAEFRSLSSKLSDRLKSFATDLASLKSDANTKLNDPGRYGDAAIPNPVNDLFGFVQNILDLIRRIEHV
jgi:hypothetical protein